MNVVESTPNEHKISPLKTQPNEMQLLRYSFVSIIQAKQFEMLKNAIISPIPTIGLNGIADKFDSYADLDEFLDDIKLLVRSYYIKYGSEPGVKRVINTLSELCHRDVKSIRTCAECFKYWTMNPNNYFVQVCSKPHIIVFAKAFGFPYWPAKVMEINGNMANVAFFGDHTQADVPVKNCILYSEQNPLTHLRPIEFQAALVELNFHIRKIIDKFGLFHPTASKVFLSKEAMHQQLKDMIPNAFERCSMVMNSQKHRPEVQSRSMNMAKIEKQAKPKAKRIANNIQELPSKVSRSVIGDDVKLHFQALSRRIVELENQKDHLKQKVKFYKDHAEQIKNSKQKK